MRVLQEAPGTAFGRESAHLSVSVRSVWGRRGKDGDSAAGGKNAGWPGFAGSRSAQICQAEPTEGKGCLF